MQILKYNYNSKYKYILDHNALYQDEFFEKTNHYVSKKMEDFTTIYEGEGFKWFNFLY